jgi:hypothetical protein
MSRENEGLGVPVAEPTVGLRPAISPFGRGFTAYALTQEKRTGIDA